MRTPSQLLAAVRRRIIRRSDIILFRSSGAILDAPELIDLKLVRMDAARGMDLDLVIRTMQRAGEVEVDASARFARGDEFFALQGPDGIVSFKWASFAEDHAGRVRLVANPRRAFIYNAFTLREYRGRGLANLLMRHMRGKLADDGRTDLVSGISAANISSLRAKQKGEFSEVAMVRELIVLHRFRLPLPLVIHDPAARELFFDEAAVDTAEHNAH